MSSCMYHSIIVMTSSVGGMVSRQTSSTGLSLSGDSRLWDTSSSLAECPEGEDAELAAQTSDANLAQSLPTNDVHVAE